MSSAPIRRVAVLGGGPAGAALGAHLARAGLAVAIFHRGKRPPIIVGESLVPAVVPFLRALGVEEEVASFSILKQGATFVFDSDDRMSFRFDEVRKARTTYSYNTPRDRFDATILEAARKAGAHVIEESGQVVVEAGDGIRLEGESLTSARQVLGGDPDLVVDAGGRSRTVARLLDLPTVRGERKDVALHAHLEGVEVEIEGNVHTDRLAHGWAWRIPLPGRVSLGFVIGEDHLRKLGETAEAQYDALMRKDPVMRDWARPARRITPVVRYSNYQLRTLRGVGPNWALLGDAFGFVDPVFSSGILIAFESADALAKAVLSSKPDAMKRYEAEVLHKLAVWQKVIGYYYDGRLLTLFRVGQYVRTTPMGRLLDFHFRKHMPRIFTGENATGRYSNGLVDFMVKYGLAGNDPQLLKVE